MCFSPEVFYAPVKHRYEVNKIVSFCSFSKSTVDGKKVYCRYKRGAELKSNNSPLIVFILPPRLSSSFYRTISSRPTQHGLCYLRSHFPFPQILHYISWPCLSLAFGLPFLALPFIPSSTLCLPPITSFWPLTKSSSKWCHLQTHTYKFTNWCTAKRVNNDLKHDWANRYRSIAGQNLNVCSWDIVLRHRGSRETSDLLGEIVNPS